MGHPPMSLLLLLDELQTTIDQLRLETRYTHDHSAFAAGAEWFADEVELLLARRLESLDNWAPPLAGATRKHEVQQLRQAIRNLTIPEKQP
jgi:hypothetical protein